MSRDDRTKIQILPNWSEVSSPAPDHQRVFRHRLIPLQVIYSRSISLIDGSEWHHVSLSRLDRIPTWDEVMKVKNDFLGEDVEAYQVLTRKQDHVNIHPNCLHFFSRTDGKRVVLNLTDIEWEYAK